MNLWFTSGLLVFVLGVSLQVRAEPWVGTTHCTPDLKACIKKTPGSTQCGIEFNKCLTTEGGVLERSDGSMTQRYHPDNPQFKKCQRQGLIIRTKAFDACMNGGGTTTASTQPRGHNNDGAPTSSPTPPLSSASVPTQTTPEVESNTPESRACQAEFGEVYQKCESESQVAVITCDGKNDEEMNSFGNSASELALRLGANTAASITASCTQVAQVSQGANAAVAAYRARCKSAQTSCFSSCSQVTTFISEKSRICFPHLSTAEANAAMTQYQSVATSHRQSCEALDTKIEQAQEAMTNYGVTLANAAHCREQTDGGASSGTLPSVRGDLSANPREALTTQKAGGNSTSDVNGSNDSPSRQPSQAASGMDGDAFATSPLEHGKLGAGSGAVAEGRQGGEALSGSGSNSGGGSSSGISGKNGVASENEHGVLGGFYGGGGSGGMFGSGSGSGSAEGAAAGTRVSGRVPSSENLQKYLPGGQHDPRFRNGANGPDGITGPHSNIWQKIQNRYQNVGPSLMP